MARRGQGPLSFWRMMGVVCPKNWIVLVLYFSSVSAILSSKELAITVSFSNCVVCVCVCNVAERDRAREGGVEREGEWEREWERERCIGIPFNLSISYEVKEVCKDYFTEKSRNREQKRKF